jgi:hypothetical protein
MMPFVYLLFLSGIKVVHPHPWVICGSHDESIAEEGV